MGVLDSLKPVFSGAIPTVLLLWILYAFISKFFYAPLHETLKKRREATSGLRESAEAALAKVEQRTAEYQEKLRAARSDVYVIQEQERQKAMNHRATLLQQAQQAAEEKVKQARQEIVRETEGAKQSLTAEAEQIASSIVGAILKPARGSERG